MGAFAASTKADGGKGVTPICVVQADSIMACGVSSCWHIIRDVKLLWCSRHLAVATQMGKRDDDRQTTLALHQRQNDVPPKEKIIFFSNHLSHTDSLWKKATCLRFAKTQPFSEYISLFKCPSCSGRVCLTALW